MISRRLPPAAIAALLLAACSSDAAPRPPPRRDATAQRRVIVPPTGTVRPLPPYAITAAEVGPYKLRQRIATLLDQLPSGPRIARFEIPGVLHTSLMRAEDDTVLIGADPNSVAGSATTFIAVIGGDVARTDSGIHVGSRRDELAKLGPPVAEPGRAFDPRVVVPASLPNARFVTDDDEVIAIAILAASAGREPADAPACPRPTPPADARRTFGACLTGAGELVTVERDELVIRLPGSDKPLTTARVPNLVFAVPLRNPSDDRDDLVAVARTDDGALRTWSIVAFRIDGGRRAMVVEPTPVYQLSSAQTRWIGADLRDIDLYLELEARRDTIEVGGLLIARRDDDKLRDVVVISPTTVTRRAHSKPATPEAHDAGIGDASDAASVDALAKP